MSAPSKPTARRRKAPLRHGRRLAVETLESRTVLSAVFPTAFAETTRTVSAEVLRLLDGQGLRPSAAEVGSLAAASGRSAPAGSESRLGGVPTATLRAGAEVRVAAGWLSTASDDPPLPASAVADLTRRAAPNLPTAEAAPQGILAALDPAGLYPTEAGQVPAAERGLLAERWDDHSASSTLHTWMARDDLRLAKTSLRIVSSDLLADRPDLGAPLVGALTARRAAAFPVDYWQRWSTSSSLESPVQPAETPAPPASAERGTFVSHVYAEWMPGASLTAATSATWSVLEPQRRLETASLASPWQTSYATPAVDGPGLFAQARPRSAVNAAQGGWVDLRLENPARIESSLFDAASDRLTEASKRKPKVAEPSDSKLLDTERNADGGGHRVPADERNRGPARRMIFETGAEDEGAPVAGRRGDCREGGMIELAGGTWYAPEPRNEAAPVFPAATDAIRMEAGRDLFQAFELASGPPGRSATAGVRVEDQGTAPTTAAVSSGNDADGPGEQPVVSDVPLERNASRALTTPLVLIVLPSAGGTARRRPGTQPSSPRVLGG